MCLGGRREIPLVHEHLSWQQQGGNTREDSGLCVEERVPEAGCCPLAYAAMGQIINIITARH